MSDDTGTDWAAEAEWHERQACPAGLPWTGDDPSSDHGHTDCLHHHTAAVGLRRLARLDTAIGDQIAELRSIHRPQWTTARGYTTEPQRGYHPVGCAECFPHDGSWPCGTAMVADDLAAVLGSGEQPEPVPLVANPALLSPDVRSYRPTRSDPARVAEARGEQPAPPTVCPKCGSPDPRVCCSGTIRPHLHGDVGDNRCCPDSWHGEQR